MNQDDRSPKFDRRQTLKVLGLTAGGALLFQGCKEEVKAPPAAPPAAAPPPAAAVVAKPAEPVAAAPAAAEPAAAAPAAAAPAGEPAVAANGAAGELNCKDKAPIDEASKGLRRALQYKEKSAEAGKNCLGCAQYNAGTYGDCGGCKLFTGAVNPGGHCLSYAPKA